MALPSISHKKERGRVRGGSKEREEIVAQNSRCSLRTVDLVFEIKVVFRDGITEGLGVR